MVNEMEYKTKEVKNFCSNCGTKLESNSKFCIKCGANISAISDVQTKPKSKKAPLIIGIIVAAVLSLSAVILGVFKLYKAINSDSKEPERDENNGTHISQDDKELEDRLLDKYWYLCFNTAYMRIEFQEDGICDILVFTKSTSVEIKGNWEYDKAEEIIDIMDDGYEFDHIYLSYNASEDCFQYIYPDDLDYEGQEDTEDWKMVYCNKRFDILDEEAYNCLNSILYGEGDYTAEFESLFDPLEETRIQKDKYAIDELRRAISLQLAYTWENVYVNPNQVEVNEDGEIHVSQLFDTTNSEGKDFVQEVEAYLGTEAISFQSNMSDDCTIQIIEIDFFAGKFAIQVISESCDLEYYILQDGAVYDGIYK